ncbi:hypothetical protein FOC27_10315 [Burkholderia multivorans]|uniref:hypothetical protein n=1 Tax=Burkholderia multivorans TaxID=87883 RepID=UPI0012DD2306|nr:hypothetical protein [Burkholderia multivorans]MBU9341712.1 hypothetical protein [Burkholderia multivorans]MCA8143886.1 hypothetical protein [Burkholderia multivorans]QGR60585.1 hypothetical protein FOC27_10315 [Burkholderia multivorans]
MTTLSPDAIANHAPMMQQYLRSHFYGRPLPTRKRRSSSPKADLAGVQTSGPESALIEVSRDLRLDERGTAENVIGRGFEVQAFRDWQSVAAVVDFNITQMA